MRDFADLSDETVFYPFEHLFSRYAVGTAHGFTLFNYEQKRIVLIRCVITHQTRTIAASIGTATLTRGRTLKKSLQDSFRRLRRTKQPTTNKIPADQSDRRVQTPVEFRDAKINFDPTHQMVRCFHFSKTVLHNGKIERQLLK